ncbi:MAG: lysylphosphatidylglycerol synthase transmembrane domain-containing protein [Anaerolineales bacterium]|nr:lysylphosphatidylglycerol synthase transmembrane domain-containing protein [Anaerolineales bacterium]
MELTSPSVARRWKWRWSYLLWLLAPLVIWLAVRDVPFDEVVRTLARLGSWQILALIALNALAVLSFAGSWWTILRAFGYRLPYLSLARGRLGAFGVAYFVPGPQVGGEAVQLLWLTQRHSVPLPQAAASVALDKTLEILVNFVLVALGLGFLAGRDLWPQVPLEAWFAAIIALIALPVFFIWTVYRGWKPLSRLLSRLPRRLAQRPFVQKVAETVRDSERHMTDFCRRQPMAFAVALGFVCLSWFLLLFDYWLSVYFLGMTLTPAEVLMGVALGRLAILIPLPGAAGVLESSQVLAMTLLGYGPALGLSQSLVMRARDISVAVFGFLWALVGTRWLARLAIKPEPVERR